MWSHYTKIITYKLQYLWHVWTLLVHCRESFFHPVSLCHRVIPLRKKLIEFQQGNKLPGTSSEALDTKWVCCQTRSNCELSTGIQWSFVIASFSWKAHYSIYIYSFCQFQWEGGSIDDLHLPHNWGQYTGTFIRNSSSHSSLVVNGLELMCLAATLCLYETRVTRVVCTCTVYAKVTMLKRELTASSTIKNSTFSWYSWQGFIGQNISWRFVANYSHYQFYKTKMLFNFACVSACESVVKVKYFQRKHWSLTALSHKYLYIGLQTWCIMGYVQKDY